MNIFMRNLIGSKRDTESIAQENATLTDKKPENLLNVLSVRSRLIKLIEVYYIQKAGNTFVASHVKLCGEIPVFT